MNTKDIFELTIKFLNDEQVSTNLGKEELTSEYNHFLKWLEKGSDKDSVIDGIISESEANGVLVECGCGEYQLAKIDIFNTKRPYCAVCNKWLDNGEQG